MKKKRKKIFVITIKGELKEKSKPLILVELENILKRFFGKDLLFAVLTGSSIYKIRKNHDIDILIVVKGYLKLQDFFAKKLQLIEKFLVITKKYGFKFDFYFPLEIIPESILKTQITLKSLKQQETFIQLAPKNTLIDFNHFASYPIWSSMLLFSKFWFGNKHLYNEYHNRIKRIMLKYYRWKTKNRSFKFISRYYYYR